MSDMTNTTESVVWVNNDSLVESKQPSPEIIKNYVSFEFRVGEQVLPEFVVGELLDLLRAKFGGELVSVRISNNRW